MPGYVLAADLGSTNFKAALFAEDGVRISEASHPLPYIVRLNMRAELDPAAVTDCFMSCVRGAIQSANLAASAIRRIVFTSQAQTFCSCDESGNPLGPFISWMDARAVEEAEVLQGIIGAEFHSHTGWPHVNPTHMISQALWWKKQNGLRATDRIVSLPSFLAMKLGAPHVSDSNLAAMSGFYSIPQRKWWEAALDASGISTGQLGAVVGPGEPVMTHPGGRPAEFSSSLDIVFAGNDHTAGAMGAGCTVRRPIMTLGTAGVLYRLASDCVGPFSSNSLWGPYPGGGYYELLHIGHACSAMDWADEFLFGAVDSPRFANHASEASVTRDSPFFDPSRWGSSGAWSGEAGANEKAYAVMEGILFALLNTARSGSLDDAQEMVVLGGGNRLTFWLQLAADIFRCPLRRGMSDGLSGAARQAGCPAPSASSTNEAVWKPGTRSVGFLRHRFEGWRAFAAR